MCPNYAAQYRGAHPPLSCTSTFALFSNNNLAISIHPNLAAQCRRVLSLLSCSSIFPLFSDNYVTTSRSPNLLLNARGSVQSAPFFPQSWVSSSKIVCYDQKFNWRDSTCFPIFVRWSQSLDITRARCKMKQIKHPRTPLASQSPFVTTLRSSKQTLWFWKDLRITGANFSSKHHWIAIWHENDCLSVRRLNLGWDCYVIVSNRNIQGSTKIVMVSNVDFLRLVYAKISENSLFWKYDSSSRVTFPSGLLDGRSSSSATFNADCCNSKGPSGFCIDSSVFFHFRPFAFPFKSLRSDFQE